MLNDISTSHEVLGPPIIPGWIIVLASILILSLGYLIYWFSKRKRSPQAPPPPFTLKEALHELTGIEKQTLSSNEQATEISLLMRRFLMIHFEDPALYETHEEYLKRGHGLEHLPKASHQQLSDYLSELASIKYHGPTDDPSQIHSLFEQTESLMLALDSTVPKDITAK